jgi:hypothetical protein
MPLFWGLPCLDYSGYNNHGTNYGATYKDGSLDFNGSSNYIGIPDTTDWAAADFSLFFRVKLDTHADFRRLVSIDDQFQISYHNTADQLSWNVEPDNVDGKTTETFLLTTGLWKNVDFVYDKASKTGQFYVDGNAVAMTNHDPADANWTNSGRTNNIIFLMARDGSTAFQDGSMSEFRITKATRTTDQIALFNDNKYGLYQKVGRPIWSIPAAPPVGNPHWYYEMIGRE